jgi:hypothetical protein
MTVEVASAAQQAYKQQQTPICDGVHCKHVNAREHSVIRREEPSVMDSVTSARLVTLLSASASSSADMSSGVSGSPPSFSCQRCGQCQYKS